VISAASTGEVNVACNVSEWDVVCWHCRCTSVLQAHPPIKHRAFFGALLEELLNARNRQSRCRANFTPASPMSNRV
jgi:hypothetical protein